jgi:hypothetical protein
MKYIDYIRIGFERTEMNCEVEFKETGYRGFALEKKINDSMMLCVSSGSLDAPKLYIKKDNSETYHIIPIPTEAAFDLVKQTKTAVTSNTNIGFLAC